jgi:hypothetical protein
VSCKTTQVGGNARGVPWELLRNSGEVRDHTSKSSLQGGQQSEGRAMQEETPGAFLGSCFATPGECEATLVGPPFREDGRARDERCRRGCEPANRVRHDLPRFLPRESYCETLPYRVRRLTYPPSSSGTRSVPTRLSSLKGEPKSMARSCRERPAPPPGSLRSPVLPEGRT